MPETSQPQTFGDYVVERELGRGGMGVVYAATHGVLGKRVAIKVLLTDVSRDAELVERFRNEARTASAIEHPSIVEIHTVGQVGDAVYIVMELLQGESLAARLKSNGAITIGDAIGLARQCANALDAAHRVGIVHRDLKPDNVFLVPDVEVPGGERVKLLDFGIAKLVGDGLSASPSVARTVTGAILGTPHYMSPEQCEGAREIDARSDLYSLGCMLFQMVTGRLPFQSAGIGGLIGMHLHVEPPTLRSVRPDVPEELDQLVSKLLAKAPEDRIQTAAEVAAALRGMSLTTSQSTLQAVAARPVDPDIATVATVAQSSTAAVIAPKRSRKWIAIGGGVVATAAITFAVARSRDGTPTRVSDPIVTQPVPVPAPLPPKQRKANPAPPSNELGVGQRMLKDGDLIGAEKQVRYLLAQDPKDPDAKQFEIDVGNARARKLIGDMRTSGAARKYDDVKRTLDFALSLTKDPAIRTEATAVWTGMRRNVLAEVRARVTTLVAAGDCTAAHNAAKLGKELGERYDAAFAECDKKAAAAVRDRAIADVTARRIAEIRYRIDHQDFALNIAQACNELLGYNTNDVPWDKCMIAACQSNPAGAFTIVNRAPAGDRIRLGSLCPQKPSVPRE